MASKLSNKQLKAREFILQVFRKEAPATKATLKKLMKVYSDIDNEIVTGKYGERLISSFLMIYKFKSHKDYTEIMKIMKDQEYFDTGLTYYGHFHNIITRKLFDSEYIKTQWIIEDMAEKGSFAEANNIVGFLYAKEKGNYEEAFGILLNQIAGKGNAEIVIEAIIRHGMNRKEKDLVSVFERIFAENTDIDVQPIRARFDGIKNKNIKVIIGNFLYEKTGDDEYLPDSTKDMFIF